MKKIKTSRAIGLMLAAFVAGLIATVAHAALPYNIGPALPPFNYSYISSVGTTTVKTSSGVLNSLSIDTPGVNSVITLYDSATSTITTTATGTITFGPASTTTSTANFAYSVIVNGVTISTTTATGTTALATANALALQIAATAGANVTAATSSATTTVITLTAKSANQYGNAIFTTTPNNMFFPGANSQFGTSSVENAFSLSYGANLATPIISKITLPATTTNYTNPIVDDLYLQFFNGLLINMSTGTSTLTATFY